MEWAIILGALACGFAVGVTVAIAFVAWAMKGANY